MHLSADSIRVIKNITQNALDLKKYIDLGADFDSIVVLPSTFFFRAHIFVTAPNITPNESNLEKGVVRIVPKGEHSSIVISILNFYCVFYFFSVQRTFSGFSGIYKRECT